MYRTLRRALCALCIPVVILAIAQTAAGDAARLFTGSYQLSNIVDDGSKVDVTVTLTLLNTGTSDVHGGVVALFDTQPNRSLLGSFSAIKSLPRAGPSLFLRLSSGGGSKATTRCWSFSCRTRPVPVSRAFRPTGS